MTVQERISEERGDTVGGFSLVVPCVPSTENISLEQCSAMV